MKLTITATGPGCNLEWFIEEIKKLESEEVTIEVDE